MGAASYAAPPLAAETLGRYPKVVPFALLYLLAFTCFIASKRRMATADEWSAGGITDVRQFRRLSRRAYTWRATRESGWPFARISRRLNHPNAV